MQACVVAQSLRAGLHLLGPLRAIPGQPLESHAQGSQSFQGEGLDPHQTLRLFMEVQSPCSFLAHGIAFVPASQWPPPLSLALQACEGTATVGSF